MQPVLTISVLISNRPETVRKCLDSLKSLMEKLDTELILTDTGCGPEVRKIIEEYTDHIIDFTWCKDFSAARNVGLEQARGQWFMYLDDDEWFEDTRAIEDFFLSGESENYNVAYYTQRNYILPMDQQGCDDYQKKITGIGYMDHYVDRIIRNVEGLHFEHRVHEAYTGVEIGRKKGLSSYVHHYGYAYSDEEEKLKKSARNKELLELELVDHPQDMRMRYQLTIDCYTSENWDEALTVAREGIAMDSDSAYQDELYNCILYVLQRQDKWQESIDFARDLLDREFYPYTYLGICQYLLKAYWKQGEYEETLQIGERLLMVYADYKHNPDEYDSNQILLDQYMQEDQIESCFLMIVEAMLGQQDGKSVSMLDRDDFRDEIEALTGKPAYCFELKNIIKRKCRSKKVQDFLKWLPFKADFIDAQIEALNQPQEVFVRPQVPMERPMAEPVELKEVSLPADFFKGETRNGFYIEPLMKHAWAASLNILYQVGQICDANGIPYYVDWGTLLGTVRHKGFIAWDDDIDVSMMRNDMFRLAQIIDEQYPSLMFIDCYTSKDHGMQAFRIANGRMPLLDRADLKAAKGFVFPAGIDIFPLDKLPADEQSREEMKAVHVWGQIANNMLLDLKEKTLLDEDYFIKARILENAIGEIEDICHMTFTERIPTQQEIMILIDEVKGLYRDEDLDDVTHLFAFINKGFISKLENYRDVIMMPFETIMVPVPIGYKDILTGEYGSDYMTPKHVPSFHDYPFYKEFFQTLRTVMREEASLEEFRARIEKRSAGYYERFLQASPDPVLAYDETYFNSESNEVEELKRIRAAESELLEEIQRICRKYDLNLYMINGDSGLNDIKQKLEAGQELDLTQELRLGIFREQYRKFIEVLPEELDVWFDYRDIYHSSNYSDLRAYIITDAYKTRDEDYKKRFHGCTHIVGLSIEPIDGLYEDQTREDLRERFFASLMKTAKNVPESGPYSDRERQFVEEWESMVEVTYSDTCNLRQEFVRAADVVASACSIETTETLGVFSNIEEGSMPVWRKSDFEHCREIAFGRSSLLMPCRSLEK